MIVWYAIFSLPANEVDVFLFACFVFNIKTSMETKKRRKKKLRTNETFEGRELINGFSCICACSLLLLVRQMYFVHRSRNAFAEDEIECRAHSMLKGIRMIWIKDFCFLFFIKLLKHFEVK